MDVTLGHDEELIRFWVTLTLIFKVTAGLKMANLYAVNGVSMHTNYVPHRRGGGHIVFGADRVGVGVSISVGMTLSCMHDIS